MPRLLGAESMHLTLCFLGNRPTREIEPLGDAVSACARAVGKLSLGAPLWLPPGRPRVLAVEIRDETGGLRSLKGDVLGALAGVCEAELTPEHRRFRPHVTVARLRERSRPRERAARADPGALICARVACPLPLVPRLARAPPTRRSRASRSTRLARADSSPPPHRSPLTATAQNLQAARADCPEPLVSPGEPHNASQTIRTGEAASSAHRFAAVRAIPRTASDPPAGRTYVLPVVT